MMKPPKIVGRRVKLKIKKGNSFTNYYCHAVLFTRVVNINTYLGYIGISNSKLATGGVDFPSFLYILKLKLLKPYNNVYS
jgi:hypothetical protein